MTLRDLTNPARWADGSPRSQANGFTVGYTGDPIDWSQLNTSAALRSSSTRNVERRRVVDGKDFTTPMGCTTKPAPLAGSTLYPTIQTADASSVTGRLRAALATGPKTGQQLADTLGITLGEVGPLLKYDLKKDLVGRAASDIFKLFKRHSLTEVFDFEHDVALGEALAAKGMLPPSFMLLQPQSWHDDVWTDVTRMLTLNGAQSAAGREMHLCPMQFDIADRAIAQYSNPGDEVYDPFGGLMTVPYRAIKAGRRGRGCELSPGYFADGVLFCEAMAREMSMPSLFDLVEAETSPEFANA